ncbi:MAG: hypothetical protein U0470_00585 [Anaerolineae bacterium]
MAARKPAARSAAPRPAAARARGGAPRTSAASAAVRRLSPARRREVVGSLLVIVGVVTLVMLISPKDAVGAIGTAWLGALRSALGWGYVVFPWLVGALGAWLVLDAVDGRADVRAARPVAGAVTFALALAALHIVMTLAATRADLEGELGVLARLAQEGGAAAGWATRSPTASCATWGPSRRWRRSSSRSCSASASRSATRCARRSTRSGSAWPRSCGRARRSCRPWRPCCRRGCGAARGQAAHARRRRRRAGGRSVLGRWRRRLRERAARRDRR